MTTLVFLAHLPGLRLQMESSGFAGLSLYKLPFSDYNALTLGAFDSYEEEYRATEPVFLAWEQEVELFVPTAEEQRKSGALQLKRPFAKSDVLAEVGAGPLNELLVYLDDVVFKAWACLSVACPTASFIAPKYSVSFIRAQGGGYFEGLDDTLIDTIQVQGEADQEYLFSPELCSSPIDTSVLDRAASFAASLEAVQQHEPLNSALEALVYSQTPLILPSDQLVLCVMALERLLLGDRTRQLRSAFARRLAAFGDSDEEIRTIETVARTLYDARSSFLHGGSSQRAAHYEALGHAPGLLAKVLVQLAEALRQGERPDALIAKLAEGGFKSSTGARWPENEPPGRPGDRLNRKKESVVASLTSTMGMREEKDRRFLWSPLIGLTIEGDAQVLGSIRPQVVMPLSARELTELEDRDIRHDYLESIEGFELIDPTLGAGRSVLLTVEEPVLDADNETVAEQLTVEVGNTVMALRMAGLHQFSDPALLGRYFYKGNIRYRRATVVRQTVLKKHFKEADRLTEAATRNAGELLDLLLLYQEQGAHEHVKRVQALFRRSFNIDFLGIPTAASLAFAALEGILGSFHTPPDLPPIEDFVRALGKKHSGWFKAEGRAFRNRVAHGGAKEADRPFLGELWQVLSRVLEVYLRFLVGEQYRGDRPAWEFRRRVAERFLGAEGGGQGR